jgi:hypothetical protein
MALRLNHSNGYQDFSLSIYAFGGVREGKTPAEDMEIPIAAHSFPHRPHSESLHSYSTSDPIPGWDDFAFGLPL